MAETVLVTGASGYVASHCIKKLLEDGIYKVKGTVRSLKNEERANAIRNIIPDPKFPVELVEAELQNKDCWKNAVQGCTYVLHVASPFPATTPRDEDELIKPAVEGVKNVLEACAEVGGIKRVVLTSSIVAIAQGHVDRPEPIDESCWSKLEACPAYEKSKTLAEKAAWDFIKDLPEEKKFELAVINPGFILGPLILKTPGTSAITVRSFMHKEMPMIPQVGTCMTDVRDVALGHIKAMTVPEAAGNRHIVGVPHTMIQLAEALDKEFRSQGYNVPRRVAPNFLIRFSSCFSAQARTTLPYLGKHLKINNDRMIKVLGIEPSDISKAVVAMAYSLVEAGIVKRTPQYHGRKSAEQESNSQEKKEQESDTQEKK